MVFVFASTTGVQCENQSTKVLQISDRMDRLRHNCQEGRHLIVFVFNMLDLFIEDSQLIMFNVN